MGKSDENRAPVSALSGGAKSAGSARSGASGEGAPKELQGTLERVCAFWLGTDCFALDIRLVGEIVTVPRVTEVPLVSTVTRGLFNLRGTPVVLLDFGQLLGRGERAASTPKDGLVALVIRDGSMECALSVDRMETVLEAKAIVAAESFDNRSVIAGYLDLPARNTRVAVLDGATLVERIRANRFSD
jgi:chemotaxis signal transduction protein